MPNNPKSEAESIENPLSWLEIDNEVTNRAIGGRPLKIGTDTYNRGDTGRVQVIDEEGNNVWPRGYASAQAAGRARGATRADFTQAWKVSTLAAMGMGTYKTPNKPAGSGRERALNGLAAAVMKAVPEESRKELNGPVRAFVGALNRRELASAAQEDRKPFAVDDILKNSVSFAITDALIDVHRTPGEHMVARVESLDNQTKKIKQGAEFKLPPEQNKCGPGAEIEV
jgi:hypothetical protein